MPTYQEGGYQITIDWSNYSRIIGEVAGVPNKVGELVAKDLERILKEKSPKGVTGQLRSGWRYESDSTSQDFLFGMLTLETKLSGQMGATFIVGNPHAWAAYVNDGTQPHVPPKDPIIEWAGFRGLPWFPVWRSICMKGTKANPYIDESIDEENSRIPLHVNEALYQMQQRISGGGFQTIGGPGI